MLVDLLIRGATLPDGRLNQDIAVRNGRITELDTGIAAQAREAARMRIV